MDAEGENVDVLYRASCKYQGWDLDHSLGQKIIRCVQVAIYMSFREQALTVLHGDLVRTLNSLSGVAQLVSHCSRNLYQNLCTWCQVGCSE